MKFYPLTSSAADAQRLQDEYRQGRQIGKISLGSEQFFFRSGRKVYYIPYNDICRYFRRVLLVPAKLCCGRGDLEVEHFVICTQEGEVAQIQLPGNRAGKALMECMASLAPHAQTGKPKEEPQDTAASDDE